MTRPQALNRSKSGSVTSSTFAPSLATCWSERGDDFWQNAVLCREERPRISQLEACQVLLEIAGEAGRRKPRARGVERIVAEPHPLRSSSAGRNGRACRRGETHRAAKR